MIYKQIPTDVKCHNVGSEIDANLKDNCNESIKVQRKSKSFNELKTM